MSERPGVGGTSQNCQPGGSAHDNKWIQSAIKFFKNEGSIRSKSTEKGGQLDRKLRWKLMTKWRKLMQNS